MKGYGRGSNKYLRHLSENEIRFKDVERRTREERKRARREAKEEMRVERMIDEMSDVKHTMSGTDSGQAPTVDEMIDEMRRLSELTPKDSIQAFVMGEHTRAAIENSPEVKDRDIDPALKVMGIGDTMWGIRIFSTLWITDDISLGLASTEAAAKLIEDIQKGHRKGLSWKIMRRMIESGLYRPGEGFGEFKGIRLNERT